MRLDTKEKRLQYRQMTLKRLSCEVTEKIPSPQG
jgi:hypothetical protein